MSVNLSKAVGYKSPSQPVSWNRRDLLTYAIGIGAKSNELNFVYELDENFTAFPTYPVVLPFKGDSQEVNLFKDLIQQTPVPGLPKFDPNRVVHGFQTIEILKPLPTTSGSGWKIEKRVVGVHEKKAGVIVESESILVDHNGTPYTKLYSGSVNIGAKGDGSNFSKSIAGPPQAKPIPKDRLSKPDWVVRESTTPEQAIVYRLSGDYNPLHIDPAIGQKAFGGVILHGLATLGFAARTIVNHPDLGGRKHDSLKLLGVRFTSPVKPGDSLETSIWEVGSRSDGSTELAFVMKNVTSGKICLSNGIAYIQKAKTIAKL